LPREPLLSDLLTPTMPSSSKGKQAQRSGL
jgi:hypothetical protein